MLEQRSFSNQNVIFDDVNVSNQTPSNTLDDNATDEEVLMRIQQKLGEVKDNTVSIPENAIDESDDIRPSKSTLGLTFHRDYAPQVKEKTSVSTKTNISTRNKVFIASYVAVVLALVLAVSLCSVSIANAFAGVAELEATYSEKIALSEELNEQLNADNYDELKAKALEMGFVEFTNGNYHQFDMLETRPAQNFKIQTNWFDQLCDWVSSAFGG